MNKTSGILWALLLISLGSVRGNVEFENVEFENSTSPKTEEPDRLSVEIYYETICPESVSFIRRRLYRIMVEENLWPYTDLKLYPFGKAGFFNNPETNETQVHCPHGEEECKLNALHACILETMPLPWDSFRMINCMVTSYSSRLDECSKELGLDVTKAKECNSTRGTPEILAPYGKKTWQIGKSFSEMYEPEEQFSFRYNFAEHFCTEYWKKFAIELPGCVMTIKGAIVL
ncbi:hypothetical protein KR018_010787 [Drosophila ironensis]|nr:hypothetical protein KR018_010787 [Drosophila ironensis]